MAFSFAAEAEQSEIAQSGIFISKCRRMTLNAIFEKFVESFALESAARVFEEACPKFFVETDGFEELAVAIAGDGRNPHARHYLPQTLFYRETICSDAIGTQSRRLLESSIGQYCAGASGDQQSNMMRVDDLPRFDDQGHVPVSRLHHRLPDCS